MPIYARIGMHLIFACMFDHKCKLLVMNDKELLIVLVYSLLTAHIPLDCKHSVLSTHKIRHLFSAESMNQGKHFDAPESVAQIPHFIKTYKLDLSELLQPDITQYKSFNDFFSRKLKPEVRPTYEKLDPVSHLLRL